MFKAFCFIHFSLSSFNDFPIPLDSRDGIDLLLGQDLIENFRTELVWGQWPWHQLRGNILDLMEFPFRDGDGGSAETRVWRWISSWAGLQIVPSRKDNPSFELLDVIWCEQAVHLNLISFIDMILRGGEVGNLEGHCLLRGGALSYLDLADR